MIFKCPVSRLHGQVAATIASELPTIHSVAESGGFSDVFVLRSSEFLGESDEKPFRPADVAEPIRVFILDYFAYELRAALAWVEYEGTDVVQKIWDGANMGLVTANGPAGHLEIYTLRLYNPEARQWGISFANRASGTLSQPAIGEFKNGRGDFYDQETYKGRTILLRFSVSDITPNSCHFEQAFSADGGKTWEANFVVTETLVKDTNGAEKGR